MYHMVQFLCYVAHWYLCLSICLALSVSVSHSVCLPVKDASIRDHN